MTPQTFIHWAMAIFMCVMMVSLVAFLGLAFLKLLFWPFRDGE